MKTAKELFDELNSWDENRRIEAKSASAVGKSMMETVCAFANEPGLRGGYLLLGAKRIGMTEDGKPVYEPENIENTDKIQSDFVAMCNSMFNVRIRPIINVEEYLGKTVIVVKHMALTSLTSVNSLTSPFAKVELYYFIKYSKTSLSPQPHRPPRSTASRSRRRLSPLAQHSPWPHPFPPIAAYSGRCIRRRRQSYPQA